LWCFDLFERGTTLKLGLRGGWQLGEGILLDYVYVPRGDSATGIDIIAKVVNCHWLKSLRLAQIGVAAGNNSAGVDVANQYTHCPGNVAGVVLRIYYVI
jgi:hypothetical protein